MKAITHILIYHHPQFTATNCGEQTVALYHGMTVHSLKLVLIKYETPH
jgi:hypothetical protein